EPIPLTRSAWMDHHRRSTLARPVGGYPSQDLPCRVRSCGGLLFNGVTLADHGRGAESVSTIRSRTFRRLDSIRLPLMRDRDRKCRPASFSALYVDPASMRFDNRMDDG